MSSFEAAFSIIVGNEGGYTNNPADPGNWTFGRTGGGVLRGTKFGISAASYPDIDIVSLTVSQAHDIYRRDYWDMMFGDQIPPPLAFLLFDAAVNCGVARAVRWLQQSAGANTDGIMGPATVAAVARAAQKPSGGAMLGAEFQALRLIFMTGLPTWRTFGNGWARRLCRLPYESLMQTNSSESTNAI